MRTPADLHAGQETVDPRPRSATSRASSYRERHAQRRSVLHLVTATVTALAGALVVPAVLGLPWHRSRPEGAPTRVPKRPSRVGDAAPPLAGSTPAGDSIELATDGHDPLLLAFLTGSCVTCRPVWEALAGRPVGESLPRSAVVTPSPSTESSTRIAELAPPGVTVVMSSDVWHDYGVTGAPWCVIVRDGVVRAEGRPRSPKALRRLASSARG